jgi:hypothetical protein
MQEKQLYAAILHQAIEDLQLKWQLGAEGANWKKVLVTDPEYYLFVSKSGYPTSFTRICDLLNLNPDKVRQGIMRNIYEAKLGEMLKERPEADRSSRGGTSKPLPDGITKRESHQAQEFNP